jgi:FKBP-type peptidyl-prolyl cis-trans isomerase FklB
MKRTGILTAIVVVIGLGSCTSFSHKSKLKTDIDSLSYFFGLSRTEGIMNYLTMQAGIDTTYMDAFIKGFSDGAKHYGPKEMAYAEGKRIAQMINNQWITSMNQEVFMGDSLQSMNRHAMLSGFYQGIRKPDDKAMMQIQAYTQILLDRVKDDYRKEKYAALIAAGKKLLEDNKNKSGIITTESGLQYRIITQGTGDIPDIKSQVKVLYRGILVDGTEFDSSFKNNAPASFRVGGVIKGWSEALMLMPVGSKWELFIPHELGYGSIGNQPTIPPYSTLIFEVELLEIEPNR